MILLSYLTTERYEATEKAKVAGCAFYKAIGCNGQLDNMNISIELCMRGGERHLRIITCCETSYR